MFGLNWIQIAALAVAAVTGLSYLAPMLKNIKLPALFKSPDSADWTLRDAVSCCESVEDLEAWQRVFQAVKRNEN